MARPRKGSEKHRPVHMGFRVSEELRQALEDSARERDVPMADVIHEILEAHLLKKKGRR